MRLNINTASIINNALPEAMRQLSLIMDARFTQAITEPIYAWPVGESPRDIIDTSELKNSQTVRLVQLRTRIRIIASWNAPYAAAVRNGYRTKSGSQMPARDWVGTAVASEDPVVTLGKLLA